MVLTLQNQLKFIVNSLAQRSFGFNNFNHFKLIETKLIQNQLTKNYFYQIPIGKQIYEEFKKDGFRFNDHGATPQSITQELLVHYNQKRHISMNVDQWGNIVASIKPEFIQDYMNQLVRSKEISILQCQEYLDWRNSFQVQNNSYVFIDLNESQKVLYKQRQNSIMQKSKMLSLSEYRQLCFRQCCKVIVQKVKKENFNVFQLRSKLLKKSFKYLQNKTLISTCLVHQTVPSQIVLNQVTNSLPLTLYKFGSVFPQEGINLTNLSQEQRKKLKKIFLKTTLTNTINLKDQIKSLSQQMSQNNYNKRPNISLLLINMQQLLNDFNFVELYKIYHSLSTKNKATPLETIIYQRMREIFQLS